MCHSIIIINDIVSGIDDRWKINPR